MPMRPKVFASSMSWGRERTTSPPPEIETLVHGRFVGATHLAFETLGCRSGRAAALSVRGVTVARSDFLLAFCVRIQDGEHGGDAFAVELVVERGA
jgi:hypothetical protein